MATAQYTPRELVASLDADALRRRLDELDRERAAVIVLLRAARARERRTQATPSREVAHAR